MRSRIICIVDGGRVSEIWYRDANGDVVPADFLILDPDITRDDHPEWNDRRIRIPGAGGGEPIEELFEVNEGRTPHTGDLSAYDFDSVWNQATTPPEEDAA